MDNFDLNETAPAVAPAYDPAKCLERLGKLTASKAGVIMGGLDTSGLQTYVKALAWERVYGARDEEYRNAAMDRGNALEASALDWYEFETGATLRRSPGFVQHPSIAYVGASPDAFVVAGDITVRALQVKCPMHGAFMETKRTMVVPSEYRFQCKWELWCSELREGEFITWHPMPGGIVLPTFVTPSECDAMAERAEVVNKMVCRWVEILQDRSEAA